MKPPTSVTDSTRAAAVIAVATLGIATAGQLLVLPSFAMMFEETGVQLPRPTKLLLELTVTRPWINAGLAAAAAASVIAAEVMSRPAARTRRLAYLGVITLIVAGAVVAGGALLMALTPLRQRL